MDKRRRIIRNIIIVAVCVAVLGATFGILHASVAADSLAPNTGALVNGKTYLVDNDLGVINRIDVFDGVTATIDGNGKTITWAGAADVPLIDIDGGGTLTVRNATIIAMNNSSAPLITCAGTLILEDVTIEDFTPNGADSAHGGAIKFEAYSGNASASLTNVIFNNCTAREGGAVYIGQNKTVNVTMTDCAFNNCVSTDTQNTVAGYYNNKDSYYGGGAICIRNNVQSYSTELTIENSSFTNCSAGLDGGAINVKHENPTATETNGLLTLKISNSTFDGCTAKDGAAIQLAGKGKIDFDFTNSTIKNCYASENLDYESGLSDYVGGGAINIINSNATSTYDIIDCKFENNECKYNGGVLRVVGELAVTDAANNNATYTITAGVPSGAKINITGTEFIANRARRGNAIFLLGTCAPTMNITNCLFEKNETVVNFDVSRAYGGTISSDWKSLSPTTIKQCLFVGNKSLGSSMSSGAAIYWNEVNGSLNIVDCHFYDNHATSQGGALFFEGQNISVTGTGTVSADKITGLNIAKLRSNALSGKGTLVRDNTSQDYGGGVGFKSCGSATGLPAGSVTFGTGVMITNNTSHKGGGLSYRIEESTNQNIKDGTSFTITVAGAVIQNNYATERGGGVYMERSMLNTGIKCDMLFNLNSGIISGNKADLNGGGIEIMDEYSAKRGVTKMTMTGGTVSNNQAVTKGGGILVYGGTFVMSGGTVSGNSINIKAEKVMADQDTLYGGGGIYAHKTGSASGDAVTISGGTIVGNITSVTGNLTGDYNSNGGGMFVHGGVNMTGGTVTGNLTSGNGGGFYVNSGSLKIYSGTVSSNQATISGGGLAVKGTGGVIIGKENCDITGTSHSHPIISQNTSVAKGGGAIVAGGTVTMHCGEITQNKASNDASTNNLSITGDGSFVIKGGYLGKGYSTVGLVDSRDTAIIKYSDGFGHTATEYDVIKRGEEFTTRKLSALSGSGFVKSKDGWVITGWRAPDGTTTANGGNIHAGYADMVLTAVWEPVRADLRITVDDCPEDDHVTIFHITGTSTAGQSVDLYVAVQGNRGKMISMPLGTYKITVDKGWRYDYNNAVWNGVVISEGMIVDLGVSLSGAANDRWLNYYRV